MRLVAHKVFTPTPGDPIDFETTIEKTLREWHARFRLRQVLFDPYQMAAVAQRLARERMPIEEYPQTVPNLTAATSNLFDLISARQLVLYPDADMRLSISRAIIVESARRDGGAESEAAGSWRYGAHNKHPYLLDLDPDNPGPGSPTPDVGSRVR